MEAFIIPIVLLIVLAVAALRFGHDSRPGMASHETHMVDHDTLSVYPDAPAHAWPEQPRMLMDAPVG